MYCLIYYIINMPDIKALAEQQLAEEKVQQRVDLYKKLIKEKQELTKRQTKRTKEIEEALVKVLDESIDIEDIEDEEPYLSSFFPFR